MIDLEAIFGDGPGASSGELVAAASDAPGAIAVGSMISAAEPGSQLDLGAIPEMPVDALEAPVWEDCLALDFACPTCGGLEAWQDFAGRWHCTECDAAGLERSLEFAERAQRMAGRAG
jgi:hypothetical protein